MGLPNVLPDVTISSDNEKMELYSNEHPFKLPLRRKEFSQEVEYKKFIKNVEQTVRRSSEYREWKQYIIDVLGINSCIITQESMSDCGLEIHHHIPSLYVLVSTMVNQKLETGEPFCSFDLCTDIIELHFQNKVGYVPLITSMHEKFHNGALEIPINYVRGDYNYFINTFSKFIDIEDLDVIHKRLQITEDVTGWTKNNYPGCSK